MRKIFITLAVWTAMAAIADATAGASSGAFTSATATPDWTQGSFGGSITWDGCGGNNVGADCSWLPVVTDQPSTPEFACTGSEAISGGDPNYKVVWSGGQQAANGTVPFQESGVPILYGVYGQRLCLSVVWHDYYQDPLCLAQAQALGAPPSTCPIADHIIGTPITWTTLTPEAPTPSPIPPSGTSPPPPTPSTPTPTVTPPTSHALTPQLTLQAAKGYVSMALTRRLGKLRSATASCRQISPTRVSCQVAATTERRAIWRGIVQIWLSQASGRVRWNYSMSLRDGRRRLIVH